MSFKTELSSTFNHLAGTFIQIILQMRKDKQFIKDQFINNISSVTLLNLTLKDPKIKNQNL